MDWHVQSPEGVLKKLGSSKKGLSEGEVQKRFAKYGKNVLRKYKSKSKFMQALKDGLGKKGSVLVYNQSFEKAVMDEGAIAFPEFREWYDENIMPRVKDLLDVFRDFAYYDPAQKGSASIKKVLPVMSDLKYDDLEISEGMFASLEYERVTYDPSVSEEDRKKVRENLA